MNKKTENKAVSPWQFADFQSYAAAQKRASETYLDRDKFASMMLVNTAKAGVFSADRAVREYADNIWHL